ncbi:carboxyl-terminal domain (ctd) phosphatase-like 2 isoform X2 [Tasmannia lanceolata]|uniref:carboxyl-terminal domain (ctd) phosphatase-like 2 isoform X2 n=1 Tax=Tasmannia lanceolata TaxID=3420 RepID=UPI004063D76A
MSRLGFKSLVYHGDSCLGEADVLPTKNHNFQFPNNEIRINYISAPSERCHPLSIIQTISPFSVRCKIELKSPPEQLPLNRLYASCLTEFKTAVVLLEDEEMHLIAMQGKTENFLCFWCCAAPIGLYKSCLGMLNLRCLAIVFDLDETLIVANTMKSFEDKIEFLQRRIALETDALRALGMKAELKRYLEDKALLKQYSENDQVNDNGKLFKIQLEDVPRLADNLEPVVRPIIRLQERNIVLTRINPEVRDTSVLVRLRPAWEDLRSYLTAKGRKRFEVYVCTMAERDYALEMWRLLDPEAHLISSNQLLDRVVCVKSGSRKSLLNVFQDGICHPKMAMVIDDRLKVWDDKDQPRVHVVPAFTPYYAPQAETANAVPVLCVARNVACNVRGGFFKEFDENLLRRISELGYEDEVVDLPFAPDVSDYLMSEDGGLVPGGNRDLPIPEGTSGAEVEQRLNRSDQKIGVDSGSLSVTANSDLKPEISQQPAVVSSDFVTSQISRTITPLQRPSLLGAAPREGESTHSGFDHDIRRRLLIMNHGQNNNSTDPYITKPPPQISAIPAQSRGGWLVSEEDVNAGQLNKKSAGLIQESEALQPDKQRPFNDPLYHSPEASIFTERPGHDSAVKAEEAYLGDERQRKNHVPSTPSSSTDDDVSLNRTSVHGRELNTESGKGTPHPSAISVGVLQEIGRRCSSKVEFRSVVSTSKDLHFSVEVLFTGEKIGVGMGKTRKEAQLQAAESALHNLASKYVAYMSPDSEAVDGDMGKLSLENDNGFLRDIVSTSKLDECSGKEAFHSPSTSEQSGLMEDSKKLSVVVSGIQELCMKEGLRLVFEDQPPVSITLNKGEYYSQVEVDGQVLGKGTGLSSEGAKLEAAEKALESLKCMVDQQAQKRANSPRSPHPIPTKRSKDESLRGLQRLSSSRTRYPKNGHPVS